jgi:hypothetical protein
VRSKTVRDIKVVASEELQFEVKCNYGYFALLSNKIIDAVEVLEICRNKELAEKAFDNLKERLSLRRMAASSEQECRKKICSITVRCMRY